jgi:hypothetical protein
MHSSNDGLVPAIVTLVVGSNVHADLEDRANSATDVVGVHYALLGSRVSAPRC